MRGTVNRLGSANTGTFTLKLSVNGEEKVTGNISVGSDTDETAENVEEALRLLDEEYDFTVTVDNEIIEVEFKGSLANKDLPLMILTPDSTFNGIDPEITEKVKGGGTSDTSIRKTAHGLKVGDFIRNTNRNNKVSQVTRVMSRQCSSGEGNGANRKEYHRGL